MPRQTPQADPVRAQARPRKRTRKPASPARAAARPLLESPSTTGEVAGSAEIDALRALLADPEAIARGSARATPPRRADARRTPARDTRATTQRPPRAKSSTAKTALAKGSQDPNEAPDVNDASVVRALHTRSAVTALLDATRTQRLARASRLRERAALGGPAPAPQNAGTPPRATTEPARQRTDAPSPGWQQRPLADPGPGAAPVRPGALATDVAAAIPAASAAPAAAIPAAERKLAADLREARSTLAIARETAQRQREEITRLRGELAAAHVPAPPETATRPQSHVPSPDEQAERLALRGRIAALEAELEQALLERAQLHQSIAAHQQAAVERSRSLSALHERLEQLERDLAEAHRRADDEHHRNAEAQSLLDHLRAALRSPDPTAAISSEPPHVAAAALPKPASEASARAALQPLPQAANEAFAQAANEAFAQAANEALPPAAIALAGPAKALPQATASSGAGLRPIFSFWLEGQVRRSFGPIGIDSIPDLVREPLVRRARPARAPLAVLLAGRGVASESRAFAEALLRSGAPEFVLHVADPDGAVPRIDFDEDPLQACVRDIAFPNGPQALKACLRALEPAVIVTRELLTWQSDVSPWLEVIRGASEAGSALVLLEQTGVGAATPDAAFAEVGERIWALLPDRYTRDPETGRRFERFGEAFAARPAPPRNELLERLREEFELELLARFGFLAEAFVRGPIAGCFDPRQARDRRFVEQIADVDERRLESGRGSALYLVARIDPAEAR